MKKFVLKKYMAAMPRFVDAEGVPSLWVALTPVAVLIASMVALIVFTGAQTVQTYGSWLLLGAAIVAALLSLSLCGGCVKSLADGIRRSGRQILPSIPILLLIGTVSATWMLSGVVPVMIDYGLRVLNPATFLAVACSVCALISILSGSSWTTIATIGVAFMGIGQVMGYSPGWIAGAIISGAYFGDKISPLSDTTVLASSSCGVKLFPHIRYMLLTTMPSMVIALVVFLVAGVLGDYTPAENTGEIEQHLSAAFNLTPWLMVIPAATALMIVLRVNSYLTLGVSSLMGLATIFIAQPTVVDAIAGGSDLWAQIVAGGQVLLTSVDLSTGDEMLDSLVATSGVEGMLPTVFLVVCAMTFGGMLIGSGMLASITRALRSRLTTARSTVTATVASGLAFNSCTGDQYLSIILASNLFRPMYSANGLERRLLSRTVEDSVSVTSVLIPWNSCGLTQSTVLGVATLTYLPYCIFNILSPLTSMFMAWAGIKVRRAHVAVAA